MGEPAPAQGMVARCRHGYLGLITGHRSADTWVGVHLSPEKAGKPWRSTAPHVIGDLAEYMANPFAAVGQATLQDAAMALSWYRARVRPCKAPTMRYSTASEILRSARLWGLPDYVNDPDALEALLDQELPPAHPGAP